MNARLTAKNAALAAVIGLLTGAAAAYVDAVALIAPAILASLLVIWGGGAYAIAAALTLAASVAIPAASAAWSAAYLYAPALMLPASLAIGFAIKRKLPYRTAVTVAALIMGVVLYLELCLGSILAGNDPFSGVETMLKALSHEMEAMVAATVGGELPSDIKMSLALLSDAAPTVTMIASVCPACLFALLDTVAARFISKRAGVATKPMAHFALWQLSKQYNYASTAALAAAIVCMVAKLANSGAVLTAALCVTFGPLALMGVCVLEFTTRMRGAAGRGPRTLLYICIVLSVPYSFAMLAIIGMIDRFTKVRRKFKPKKDSD